jgi:MFS superfamily sulfate permease-like transporter
VIVNNSINIDKTKESLNSDDIDGIVDHHCLNFLLFCRYWWNCWPSLFKLSFVLSILMELMVNNFINIIKTKESLNSDGQQFHQYHQNKRKFKQWWSTIPSHHCLNFLLFWWYWWNCWPSLFKLSFVLMILVELFTLTWNFLLFWWYSISSKQKKV